MIIKRLPVRVLPLLAMLALAGCGDSTTLTGPDAVAAAERFQASAESGAVTIHGAPARPDRPAPLIFLDGRRIPGESTSVLRSIQPGDIARIEVTMGCRARGFWGDDARSGAIHIYTKQFEGPDPEWPEFSEARAEACKAELLRPRSIRR